MACALRIGLLLGAAASLASCARPGGPAAFSKSEFSIPDAGAPPPTSTVQIAVAAKCTPAQSSTPLPARTTLAGQDAGVQAETYLTSDLFNINFTSICGGCHVDSNLGGFNVTESSFPMAITPAVYALITSNDPAQYMPPQGSPNAMPFDQRPADDPVRTLANLLNLWMMAGSPPDQFPLPAQAASSSTGYSMTATLGAQLTNIGSCIPDKTMVGANDSAMDTMDAFFAQATALPSTLDQTDLVSLNSEDLAKNGVVSYAPTYPLWTDNAGKMRYVRVPRGQSIGFNRSTQQFTIPPNTRFYKTFLKEVTDANGNSTYRKIETRVIVSRPDTTSSDGTTQQNALYGSYLWNQDESQASLSDDPLRDGLPFADRIFTYITDEQKEAQILATNPASPTAAETAAGIVRHYAVPGSERCVQCHMGSPSKSFILGFTPLQVARRNAGEGGIYEPASGDELTQLQRLIDYGVITGMTSPSDVLPLEESEGSRAPRNVHELNAQAYMIGNCAHCHNPRGYPSIRQPELANVLIFLPGTGANEGIFQFPLETMSPIRKRGIDQNVEMPYVTPSLYDLPSYSATDKFFCPTGNNGSCGDNLPDAQWILAPWRSLIYRNTDTPYDYFDDYALFPHMPLNSPGYDCRVAGIMGDWMVSIPARVKDPTLQQNALPIDGTYPDNANDLPQPYEEVFPSDSDYAAAVGGAQVRLSQYHSSYRYDFCPSTYTADIVDSVIQSEVDLNRPVTPDLGQFFSPTDPSVLIMPRLTPIRPDYISFDDTDPPGDWFPRRPDWATTLVNPDVPTLIQQQTMTDSLSSDAAEDLGNVITALEKVTLTDDARAALTQKVPFGLWDTTVPGCNFTGIPTAGSFTGSAKPQWMILSPPPTDAPVLVESAGASVFTTVCFNCHGLQADSRGLLADEITSLTGGSARVADLRDGLLGPVTSPGTNRDRVFGDAATTLGVTADDLASRYMAWMTLGGTEKHLPEAILTEVAQSPVVGQVRSHIELTGSPDMLRLGLQLCEQIVGGDAGATQIPLAGLIAHGAIAWSDVTGLVDSNGDAEMWLRLCNLGNRQIVRVPYLPGNDWTDPTAVASLTVTGTRLYWATDPNGVDYYGANPVLDHLGNVDTGVTTANLFPVCIQKPTDATQLQAATQALQATQVLGKNPIPFCPDGFVQASHQLVLDTTVTPTNFVDARAWAARGAINAALAVFLYLDQIERDPTQRQPLYTECNLIGTTP